MKTMIAVHLNTFSFINIKPGGIGRATRGVLTTGVATSRSANTSYQQLPKLNATSIHEALPLLTITPCSEEQFISCKLSLLET